MSDVSTDFAEPFRDLTPADLRNAMLRVCENADTVEDARKMLQALGLIQ